MKLHREGRQYLHLPFWGLGGATPMIQVGDAASWVSMAASPGSFEPPAGWSPPTGFLTDDAEWYQVLLAGPDATSNPIGTIVVSEPSRMRTKVVAGDEIDIEPDTDEWIFLHT